MKRIEDVPWPLQEAIGQGLSILAWHENYLGDELPPENLWDDAEFLDQHFKKVQEKKKAEMGGGSYDGDDDSDSMMSNDLASVFKD